MAKAQDTATRNARAYAAGFRGVRGEGDPPGAAGAYRAYERARRAGEYALWAERAAEAQDKTLRQVRGLSSEFNRLYAASVAADFKQTKRGAFHKLLVHTGLRDPKADYKIGDTPQRKRR